MMFVLYVCMVLTNIIKAAAKCWGGSSTGAMGAWAPADIQQCVPGTRPEMFLGIKVSIYFQKYQDFK